MKKKQCLVQLLGQVPFQQAWDYQNALADQIAKGERSDTLLLLEHPHTFTFGRQGNQKHLLWTDEELRAKGVDVLWVDRGGDITYHGPGQLVGYPLFRLGKLSDQGTHLPRADYLGYIRKLEAVLIDTLRQFGIIGMQLQGKTGVWVQAGDETGQRKIASIGIKVDARGISRHGFALNVNPDMGYWQGIVPCGLSDDTMISMAELSNHSTQVDDLHRTLICSFGDVFSLQMKIEEEVIPEVDASRYN